MEDDPQEKAEGLWIQEIAAVVKKLQTAMPVNLDDFIFEAWDTAIAKVFRYLSPDFMKGWSSLSRGFKEEEILPGAFADKSFIYFRKVVLDALTVMVANRPPSRRGSA